MFELLSSALFITLIGYGLYVFIQNVVPKASLTLLGTAVVGVGLTLLLIWPDNRTVLIAGNIVVIYLLGTLCFFIYKKKVSLDMLLTILAICLFFSLPIVADALTQLEEQKALDTRIQPTVNVSGPIVLLATDTTRPDYRPTLPNNRQIQTTDSADLLIYTVQLAKLLENQSVIICAPERLGVSEKEGDKTKNISEAEDVRSLLITLGIENNRLQTLTLTRDTGLDLFAAGRVVNKYLQDNRVPKRVVLITTATETERAVLVFRRLGIDVIPSPANFRRLVTPSSIRTIERGGLERQLLRLIPSADALNRSVQFVTNFLEDLRFKVRTTLPGR